MTSNVQKPWNYCNVLRNDGLIYSDYVDQLTYLLISFACGLSRV